ncbi:hypothetical protein GCM10027406_31600 [Leifsonia lichenia]
MTEGEGSPPAVAAPRIAPDEYDIAGREWLASASRKLSHRIHPLLASVPTVTVAELPHDASDESDADTNRTSGNYRPIKVAYEWIVSVDTALNFDLDTFLSEVYGLADSFGSQLSSGFISFASDTAKAAGQEIDASDKDIFDALAEMMEKLEFSFDENGNHNMSLVMHPDTAEKLQGRQPTAEQSARIDDIIARKRKEWDASRRRRELP